jgi:CarboxypepD_reg-like domain
MLEKKLFVLMLFFSLSVFSQIKGKVIDEKNQPVSFVNIAVENENSGTTSEENGEFSINLSDKNKNLIFSALGFEKKIVKASESFEVKLKSKEYQLDEVLIAKRFETKERLIGETDNSICQAFDNGPRIDIKFFPNLPIYKKTKFIKYVTIYTDSRIEKATIKIHFYKVDINGFPGEEMLKKDFIVTVKKGTINNVYDLTDLNLKMPLKGLFVGFEKLIIEKNKLEKTISDFATKTTKQQITYYPFAMYNRIESEFQITFSGGKWNKQTNDSIGKMMIFEPAIKLVLTN